MLIKYTVNKIRARIMCVRPAILVIYYREDDPRKNTSVKMVAHGLARRVTPYMIRGLPIVLNPYSREYLGTWHKNFIDKHGVVVVDASWKKLSIEKFKNLRGKHVKLPPLLPGNPINYGKPCILSSIEAVAATLYITGYRESYEKLLGLYKWMNTFHTLNQELLEEYSKADTPEKLHETIKDYWGENPPC